MRNALELVITAQPASAKRGSSSAAIEESSAAKITLGAPSGVAGETRIFAIGPGIAVFIRQRAASAYSFPAERSDAASQAASNQGWCSSSWIKRCPTMPVAPRIPTGILLCIRRLLKFYNREAGFDASALVGYFIGLYKRWELRAGLRSS